MFTGEKSVKIKSPKGSNITANLLNDNLMYNTDITWPNIITSFRVILNYCAIECFISL